jgi:hypothetical protein
MEPNLFFCLDSLLARTKTKLQSVVVSLIWIDMDENLILEILLLPAIVIKYFSAFLSSTKRKLIARQDMS